MSFSPLWLVVGLLVFTSVGIMLARDWRWSVIFLAIQYLGVFILALQHWPISMATVKITAGWMSVTILSMTRSNLPDETTNNSDLLPQSRFFRLIAAGFVGLITAAGTPQVDVMMADAGMAVTAGSLLLIGMGLLHLGVTDQVLEVIIGLMTVISGFEILYTAVESSILVAALLAIVNLGLALAGSYLMIASNSHKMETT